MNSTTLQRPIANECFGWASIFRFFVLPHCARLRESPRRAVSRGSHQDVQTWGCVWVIFPVTNQQVWRSWPVLDKTWHVNDPDLGSTSHELLLMPFCKTAPADPGSGACPIEITATGPSRHLWATDPWCANRDAEPSSPVHFSFRSICSPFCPWSNFYRAAVDRPRCPVAAPFWARLVGLEVRSSWWLRWGHTRALTPSQKRKASMILVMKRTGRDPKLPSSPIFFWAIKLKRMREFPSYFLFFGRHYQTKEPPRIFFWNLGLKRPSDAVGTPGLMSGVKMHL